MLAAGIANWIVLAAMSCTISPAAAVAGAPGPVDFSRDVLPILSENCFTCHGPDAKTRKADLRLDVKESALRTTDPVIVAGQEQRQRADRSRHEQRPGRSDAAAEVGQEADRRPDRAAEEMDRPGRVTGSGHWAFEPMHRLAPAAGPRPGLDQEPDRPVRARPARDRRACARRPRPTQTTLIRRLCLDLTGLPPTPEEVDAFLAAPRPSRTRQLVDRLLASPHYGERMAMDWLDGARFADTNGFQNDFARTMWPWRDWVIAAFNRNQPFDRFLIEQLAGDLLPGATLAQRIATGFNRNNRTVTEAGSIDEEYRDRERRRPRRDHGDGLPRPDDGLRPLPRPQVRPGLAGRVLPVPAASSTASTSKGVYTETARQRAAA